MGRGKTWPDEDAEYLKNAYEKYNLSVKEISEALKKSESSIRSKVTKLNLKRPKEELPEGYKRCARCKQILPLKLFHKKNSSKTGIGSYCAQCKSEMFKEYKNKKRQNQKNNIINNTKIKRKKCNKCGKIKPIEDFCYDKVSIRSYCKECKNKRDKERRLERERERGY